VFDWLFINWQKIVVPLIAFLATLIVGFWSGRIIDDVLKRRQAKSKWPRSQIIRTSIRHTVLFWFFLLGVIISTQVSVLSLDVKSIVAKAAGSLFVFSLGRIIIIFLDRTLKRYLPAVKASYQAILLTINVLRITVIVVSLIIVLQVWGIPTTPILLVTAVIVLAIAFVLINVAPHFLAGIQLAASQHIKGGDFIKLESGEEGYIVDMKWNNTQIKTLDNKLIIIPNNRLLQQKVINYGKPLKKAKESFHFFSRTHLTELTGLQAKNLKEFVDIIKTIPDAVMYYHTHHFLEEHHYLTLEPSNDFGIWVTDSLGEEALGERISSINAFDFPTLGVLKERLVDIIEEHLAKSPNSRETMKGREFYFMKSVAVIVPTNYFADDLNEFKEILSKISIGSLYFHIFESRMRLGKGLNDFSVWMRDSLGENELSEQIERFDPFSCTLEGLRLTLIQSIEKHIRQI
jgi:small-conductance mechanosensitive channel